jgi:CBS domain-containing protein
VTVRLVCNHNVATIDSTRSVVDAAASMREQHVGDLIVVEHRDVGSVPIGILTDRDIVVGVVAKRVPADQLTVGDAMTREPLTLREDHGIEFALREMRRCGVRRAPVVGSRGELVGVLSIDDVVQHLAAQLEHLVGIIRLEQDHELTARP